MTVCACKKFAEIGDIIEWVINDDCGCVDLRGKTFTANVAAIFIKERLYGVYAEYGMDYIGFDQCNIINNPKCNTN